ncbi:hypothetical protein HHK36_006854 [Tetracentron sinense]|uniref:Uncharacterized protein n=1 Tax=Tetracentron sinense TaxID=13715 RepID=A0A835DPG9_TETSI|nr:hypothetical protein HHK36_006854 [Tetracentron sinense]
MPKAFKHIPSLELWEDVLYLTEPEKWSPNAMYQATRIFSSNFGVRKAQRFYKLVLLQRVREDIRKNKRLHFALYQALKKSLYKPAAFFKGILFPLCVSLILLLLKLLHKASSGKKYALPYRVLDAVVAHFMRFLEDSRIMHACNMAPVTSHICAKVIEGLVYLSQVLDCETEKELQIHCSVRQIERNAVWCF